jgi:hypothetical protein
MPETSLLAAPPARTYVPPVVPRDYQRAALAKMAARPAFALLMAMRTGKTKTLLDDFCRREVDGEVDDLLVIAPAGVYRTWLPAIAEHVGPAVADRLRVHTWRSGPNKAERIELETFLTEFGGPRIFLVNVEALSTATGAREACLEFLAPRRAMIAVDESTVIKSKSAKRTKFINKELAPRAEFRRILSGLPTPRSPLDLYAQFEFLDPAILRERSYYNFMKRYAITRSTNFGGKLRRPVEIVVGYRNEDQLRRLIEPYSYRIEFRPEIPSTYSIREVTLTAEQRRIYAEMKEYATAKIDAASHVTATIVIVQMLRLHQVLMGHVVDEDGVTHDVPERRTDALLEVLADYNGKAIIWASYDRSIRRIAAAIAADYGDEAVACFWGGNPTTREADEARFKTDPRCRFMIATPDSGGRGRTWDGANLVVYYSSKNNLEHREQSEQRAQNVGKAAGVDYIDLVAPGTVDGVIIKALREKIDMASAITGDTWKTWLI